MKKAILFLSLVLAVSAGSFAQTNKNLVVVINRADWCPTCKAHNAKINNEVIPFIATLKTAEVVLNDVTNNKTKKTSKVVLESAGVYETVKVEKATGIIILINHQTGKIIKQLSVVNSTEDIKKAITEAAKSI